MLVDASHGGALPRARITVISGRRNGANVLTDNEGRFSVGLALRVPPSIRIVKAGYAAIIRPVTQEELRASDPLRPAQAAIS